MIAPRGRSTCPYHRSYHGVHPRAVSCYPRRQLFGNHVITQGRAGLPENEFVSGQVYVALGSRPLGLQDGPWPACEKSLLSSSKCGRKIQHCINSKKGKGWNTVAWYRPRQGYLDGAWPPSVLGGVESSGAKAIIGSIEQPSNFSGFGSESFVGRGQATKGFDLEKVYKLTMSSVSKTIFESASHLGEEPGRLRIICYASGVRSEKEVTKDKNGNRRERITRSPRRARFNVLHHRQVAMASNWWTATVTARGSTWRLWQAEMAANESPSLFLSLPDPLKEFKQFFVPQMGFGSKCG